MSQAVVPDAFASAAAAYFGSVVDAAHNQQQQRLQKNLQQSQLSQQPQQQQHTIIQPQPSQNNPASHQNSAAVQDQQMTFQLSMQKQSAIENRANRKAMRSVSHSEGVDIPIVSNSNSNNRKGIRNSLTSQSKMDAIINKARKRSMTDASTLYSFSENIDESKFEEGAAVKTEISNNNNGSGKNKIEDADEKRRKNCLASARFRQKKKQETQMLEEIAAKKTEECEALSDQLESLQSEVVYLRQLLMMTTFANAATNNSHINAAAVAALQASTQPTTGSINIPSNSGQSPHSMDSLLSSPSSSSISPLNNHVSGIAQQQQAFLQYQQYQHQQQQQQQNLHTDFHVYTPAHASQEKRVSPGSEFIEETNFF
eukprot:Awhi_evm1s13244